MTLNKVYTVWYQVDGSVTAYTGTLHRDEQTQIILKSEDANNPFGYRYDVLSKFRIVDYSELALN